MHGYESKNITLGLLLAFTADGQHHSGGTYASAIQVLEYIKSNGFEDFFMKRPFLCYTNKCRVVNCSRKV